MLGGACCTHAYVISWHGALRLLRAMDPLTAPIDEVMRELCFTAQIACYILQPDASQDVDGGGGGGGGGGGTRPLPHGLFVQDWQAGDGATAEGTHAAPKLTPSERSGDKHPEEQPLDASTHVPTLSHTLRQQAAT